MDAKSETLRARIFNLCARSRDVPVLRLKIQKVFTNHHYVVVCKYLLNFQSEHRNIAGTCTQIGGWCFTFAPVLAEFSYTMFYSPLNTLIRAQCAEWYCVLRM